jgi:CysZ protein
MGFGAEFGRGLRAYSEAHRVIFKYKLTKYLWLPGIVTLVYTTVFFAIIWHFSQRIAAEADSYPAWLRWMGDFTYWFLKSVYWVAAIFVFWVSLKYVLQVLLSPILSNLSVAVEKRVWGQEPDPITWGEFFQDMGRSLMLAIRNGVIEISLCLVVGFIPGVGQVAGLLISSYFYGFGYMDYVLERKRMSIPQAVAFCRAHKGLAVGIGMVNNLLMLVPFVGWVLAPTYATVAATLETLRILSPQDTRQLDAFTTKTVPQ